MQPPKNRYSQPRQQAKQSKLPALPKLSAKPKKSKANGLKKSKGKLPRPARKVAIKQIRRFTHENVFTKYFLRSLAASIAALLLLVLATMFTPLLAIDKIVVSGNDKVSAKEISAVLKHRLGSALPMVSESDVADDLKKFKLIESISLISRPPHVLEVRVTERTAISIVVRGGTRYLYDPAGVNLGAATGYEKLPTIIVSDDPKTSKNFAQAIDVLLALPAQLLDRVAYIQAKSRDNVTMQLRGNATQTIIWGDSSDSILKSKVLKALLLKTSPKIRATFDVSSPLTPSVIR